MLNKIPVKQDKLKQKREEVRAKGNAEASKVVERVDREIHRPDINIRNWETEAPSSEVRFKKKIKTFEEAWRLGKNLLMKAVEHLSLIHI